MMVLGCPKLSGQSLKPEVLYFLYSLAPGSATSPPPRALYLWPPCTLLEPLLLSASDATHDHGWGLEFRL